MSAHSRPQSWILFSLYSFLKWSWSIPISFIPSRCYNNQVYISSADSFLDLQIHVSNCLLDLSTNVHRTSQTYHGQSRTFNFSSYKLFFSVFPHPRKWHYFRKRDCLEMIKLETCESILTYPPSVPQHSFYEQSPLRLPTNDAQVAVLLVEAYQLRGFPDSTLAPSPCSKQSELLKT